MGFDRARGQALLGEVFAPWIQALQLRCESVYDDGAELRLPVDEQLSREGGTVCGQALMALADTASVLAVCAASGGYRPMTTVSQSIDLLRPLAGEDGVARASVTRLGRTLAFIRVDIRGADSGKPVASAQLSYAILGPVESSR